MCKETKKDESSTSSQPSTLRWLLGMFVASIFSLIYIIAPLYSFTSIVALCLRYPTANLAFLYASPFLLSALIPSMPIPWLLKRLSPMLNYFDYEEIFEHETGVQEMLDGKNYILGTQPHGVISFCGICSAIKFANSPTPQMSRIQTAVASALLKTPILKHVMGVFNLTDASAKNLRKVLSKPGVDGCIVIYVGGIAELFKTSLDEERLYLKNRKGFIKLALREGVDILPIYLFGNTSVLSIVKNGILAQMSRKLGVSLTMFWGKFNLPIPRDDKLLYVAGKPLGMPKIAEPTQEDIDKWHKKYCDEVQRIFETYKHKVPAYENKKLYID